jgi:UMF1 family MFS transporter
VPGRAIPARAVASWVIYDLANTIFSMGVISLAFPVLVEQAVGADRSGVLWGVIQSVSYGIIFVTSPLLGAMTDRARRRMPFLVWSTLIAVVTTAAIGRGSFFWSAVLFIIANATYQAGLQFYDALLTEVATEENRGRVSGIGVGVGYLGSFLAIGFSLYFQDDLASLFLAVAASFLLLALPCFFFVVERGNPQPRTVLSLRVVRESTAETWRTLQSSRQFPGLLRFLVGRVFYTDAINTVIGFMVLYALHVASGVGLDTASAGREKDLVMLVAILCAVVAGLVWGRVVDRIGPKRTLALVLGVWMVTLAAAAAVGAFRLPMATMYVVASAVGVAMAGTWAADRPYMLRLTPPHRVGEFYGLYGMVGRFSAITGPLVWAITIGVMQRAGFETLTGEALAIVVMLAMIAVGYRILKPVTDEPRDWAALGVDVGRAG